MSGNPYGSVAVRDSVVSAAIPAENDGPQTGEAGPRIRRAADVGAVVGMMMLCVASGAAVVMYTRIADGPIVGHREEGAALETIDADAITPGQAVGSEGTGASHGGKEIGAPGSSGTGSMELRHSLCIHGRVAPTFIMPGCQKCGTTSFYKDMYDYMVGTETGTLDAGGAINTTGTSYYSNIKEKHFYEHDVFYNDLDLYWNLYPKCDETMYGQDYVITTDYTPNYMFETEVPERMKNAYLSDDGTKDVSDRIKLFFLLREPVARMQSYYYAAMGSDLSAYTTFAEYAEVQYNMTSNCTSHGQHDAWPSCRNVYTNSMSEGQYGYQLERWLEFFKPEQIYIIPYPSYVGNTDDTLHQTAEILGLTMTETIETATWSNVGSHNSIGADLDEDLLAKVVDSYKLSNQKVYDLIEQYNLTVVPGNHDYQGFLDYNMTSSEYPYGTATVEEMEAAEEAAEEEAEHEAEAAAEGDSGCGKGCATDFKL